MEFCHFELRQGIGVLHLHAGNANALNAQVVAALAAGLQEARAAGAKGLVLTGSGRFFCAGLDLITTYSLDRRQMGSFLEDLEMALQQLFTFPLPVLAAINGTATAGGCILALCGDYRIMAATAGGIGLTEIRLGLPLPAAALEIVRFSIPVTHHAHVFYSGKLFPPAEAQALGLVHEVVPPDQLLEAAWSRMHLFTHHPGDAGAVLKASLRRAALDQMIKGAGATREAFLDAWFSPAARQSIAALRRRLLARNPTAAA